MSFRPTGEIFAFKINVISGALAHWHEDLLARQSPKARNLCFIHNL